MSTRQIYQDWKSNLKLYDCPAAETNLAGTLGIKDLVSMATSSPGLNEEKTGQTVFGGSIQFVVAKSLSAFGPSWQLVRFKNIAALANLSEINTDKIILSFAPGPNRGKRLPRVGAPNAAANQFLQQLIINAISNELVIQNNRH